MRREKQLRDRTHPRGKDEKMSETVRVEQEAIKEMIKRAEALTQKALVPESAPKEAVSVEKSAAGSPLKKRLANTSSTFVGEVTIPPKIKYAMKEVSVQAEEEEVSSPTFAPAKDATESIPQTNMASPPSIRKSTTRRASNVQESVRKSTGKTDELEGKDPATKPQPSNSAGDVTKEALTAIMATPGFGEFFAKSSKLIERVLQNPESDLVIDYFGDSSESKEGK